jgi:nicotinamidase-related amidase
MLLENTEQNQGLPHTMFKILNRPISKLRRDLLKAFPSADTADLKKNLKLIPSTNHQKAAMNFDAVLVIDVQKHFCDPAQARGTKDTDKIAKHIANTVPAFRKAGWPIYNIYFSHEDVARDYIDFHHYAPEETDITHAKYRASAFDGEHGGAFAAQLKARGHQHLLLVGFNTSACIAETVQDAQKLGFQCAIAVDAIGNDKTINTPQHVTLKALIQNHNCTLTTSLHALRI